MIAPPSTSQHDPPPTPVDPEQAPPDPPQPLRVLDHSHRPQTWTAVVTAPFASKPSSFLAALEQMVQHPEHSTSWILRSDTLSDTLHPLLHPSSASSASSASSSPEDCDAARTISVPGYTVTRTLVRRFVPRNPARDAPAVQTCLFLSHTAALAGDGDAGICELVAFVAHSDDAASTPYYLPSVRGVGWLLFPSGGGYALSLLYALFPGTAPADTDPVGGRRLERTAGHLLARAQKLAAGLESGYVQRVHHDLLVPRETFQDLYLALRGRHAGRLLSGWREKTDPRKHVFEDILIATFLICLWERMFPSRRGWKGFADVGCGNGVLVDILLREGWSGVGIDARARKSWAGFCPDTRRRLLQRVLVPWLLVEHEGHDGHESQGQEHGQGHEGQGQGEHDGRFDEGTFIVSNHADELTAWTPLLAAGSNCPFLAIPCCSHDLSGAKKRFPPPPPAPRIDDDDDGRTGDLRRNANASKSTYSSLCAYVERLARDCGWRVEREVLRIPSTRNVAIVGRHRVDQQADAAEVLRREGCGKGWRERVHALKRPSSGH